VVRPVGLISPKQSASKAWRSAVFGPIVPVSPARCP
jgi:hypothetical protein